VERKDVTVQAWQILKVAEAVERDKGQQTLGMLTDLARGTGKGTFDVRSGGRNGKEKNALDLNTVAHGKVDLSKEVTAHSNAVFCFLVVLKKTGSFFFSFSFFHEGR
jgi:ATP-dependent DNA helicase Q1